MSDTSEPPSSSSSFINTPSSPSLSSSTNTGMSSSGSISIISNHPAASSSSPSPAPTSPADELDDDDSDEVDYLPSSPDSESELDENEDAASDAEREWKESLQQLELLLTMVIVPYLGRYFGRRCAYWGWKRWMEWRYPVEVVFTNKSLFKASGAVLAAAPL